MLSQNKMKMAGVFCCALFLGVFFVKFLLQVEGWGHFIPQNDLIIDYAIALLWAIILGATIPFWPVSREDRTILLWGWVAKVLVVLGLMLLYENAYNLDAYGYWSLSRSSDFDWGAFFGLRGMNMGEGASWAMRVMVNFVLLLKVPFFNSYHASKLSFAMLGLVGIYFIYLAASAFMQNHNRRFFYVLAFFPTILFWSSILGKEPITFLGMAFYMYGVVQIYQTGRFKYLFFCILGIVLETWIRVWYGIIMGIPLILFLFIVLKSFKTRIAFTLLLGVFVYLAGDSFITKFKIETIFDIVGSLHKVAAGFASTPGGSNIKVSIDLTNPMWVISYIPVGMLTALFRPLPGEVMNPFGLLIGFENVYLLGLLYLSFKRTHWKELKHPLFLWALLLILLWAISHAFILNMGTLVRYKLQIMPVLFCLLLYLSRKREPQKIT